MANEFFRTLKLEQLEIEKVDNFNDLKTILLIGNMS